MAMTFLVLWKACRSFTMELALGDMAGCQSDFDYELTEWLQDRLLYIQFP